MTAVHHRHTTETHEWTLPAHGPINDIGEAGTAAQNLAHNAAVDPGTIYYRIADEQLVIGFAITHHTEDPTA